MSKKMLKRSLALSALMAFVITGSAMAAQLDGSTEYIGAYNSATGAGNNVTIEGSNEETVTFTGSTTGYINGAFRADSTTGSTLKNIDTIVVNNGWDNVFLTNGSGVMTIENVKNIISNETTSNAPYRARFFHALGGTLNVGTDEQGVGSINLKNVGNAFYAQTVANKNGEINVNAESIYIESYSGAVIGATDFNDSNTDCKSTVSITADNVTIKALNGTALSAISGTIYQDSDTKKWITDTDSAGVNHEDNSITITSDLLNIEAKDAVIAKNGSTDGVSVNLNSKNIVIKAENDAVLAKDKANVNIGGGNNFDKADITGNIASSYESSVDVKLGNGGSLTGSVITGNEDGDTSTTSLDLGVGSTWNVKDTSTVTTLSGNSGTLVVSDITEGLVTIGTDNTEQLTVSADASVEGLEGDAETKLKKVMKTIVITNDEGGEDSVNTAKITNDPIYEDLSANFNAEGDIVGDINKEIASANVSINDMVAIGMMSWRAEMNDMNKRMGELRNANGEHGVWVRMVRGESEYNSVKNQYNQYQLGYDEKLSVDKRWTVGAAISYTDAENNFAEGTGESTNKALSIYGSKLNDDGTFVDLIAKYARLDNDFKTLQGQGAAEYDTNAYSFSAEVGKRIQQGKGLWIEPQVELTYGKVSAVDYVTAKGVNVAQDGMESLVGRIGFSLGKDIEKGNVYARASYLYDFDGETKAVLDGDAVLENDIGGGWFEVGVGANINLSKATYIYADIEKTFGGEVDTNWQWNLGVRYSF